jgi:hypothetical protein
MSVPGRPSALGRSSAAVLQASVYDFKIIQKDIRFCKLVWFIPDQETAHPVERFEWHLIHVPQKQRQILKAV